MKAKNFLAEMPSLKFQKYPEPCTGIKHLMWTNSNLVKAEYLYRDGELGGAISAINAAQRSLYEARREHTIDVKTWGGYKDDVMGMKEMMLEKGKPKAIYELNKKILERLTDEIIRGAIKFCSVSD